MATKKQAAIAKQSLAITLAEFKAWLQGVEDMQPANWSPNTEQWKRIREKIDHIDEYDVPVVQRNYGQQVPRQIVVPPTQAFVPAPQMSSLPVIERPNVPNPANLLQGDKLLTPSIDTSDGNYNSMFV